MKTEYNLSFDLSRTWEMCFKYENIFDIKRVYAIFEYINKSIEKTSEYPLLFVERIKKYGGFTPLTISWMYRLSEKDSRFISDIIAFTINKEAQEVIKPLVMNEQQRSSTASNSLRVKKIFERSSGAEVPLSFLNKVLDRHSVNVSHIRGLLKTEDTIDSQVNRIVKGNQVKTIKELREYNRIRWLENISPYKELSINDILNLDGESLYLQVDNRLIPMTKKLLELNTSSVLNRLTPNNKQLNRLSVLLLSKEEETLQEYGALFSAETYGLNLNMFTQDEKLSGKEKNIFKDNVRQLSKEELSFKINAQEFLSPKGKEFFINEIKSFRASPNVLELEKELSIITKKEYEVHIFGFDCFGDRPQDVPYILDFFTEVSSKEKNSYMLSPFNVGETSRLLNLYKGEHLSPKNFADAQKLSTEMFSKNQLNLNKYHLSALSVKDKSLNRFRQELLSKKGLVFFYDDDNLLAVGERKNTSSMYENLSYKLFFRFSKDNHFASVTTRLFNNRRFYDVFLEEIFAFSPLGKKVLKLNEESFQRVPKKTKDINSGKTFSTPNKRVCLSNNDLVLSRGVYLTSSQAGILSSKHKRLFSVNSKALFANKTSKNLSDATPIAFFGPKELQVNTDGSYMFVFRGHKKTSFSNGEWLNKTDKSFSYADNGVNVDKKDKDIFLDFLLRITKEIGDNKLSMVESSLVSKTSKNVIPDSIYISFIKDEGALSFNKDIFLEKKIRPSGVHPENLFLSIFYVDSLINESRLLEKLHPENIFLKDISGLEKRTPSARTNDVVTVELKLKPSATWFNTLYEFDLSRDVRLSGSPKRIIRGSKSGKRDELESFDRDSTKVRLSGVLSLNTKEKGTKKNLGVFSFENTKQDTNTANKKLTFYRDSPVKEENTKESFEDISRSTMYEKALWFENTERGVKKSPFLNIQRTEYSSMLSKELYALQTKQRGLFSKATINTERQNKKVFVSNEALKTEVNSRGVFLKEIKALNNKSRKLNESDMSVNLERSSYSFFSQESIEIKKDIRETSINSTEFFIERELVGTGINSSSEVCKTKERDLFVDNSLIELKRLSVEVSECLTNLVLKRNPVPTMIDETFQVINTLNRATELISTAVDVTRSSKPTSEADDVISIIKNSRPTLLDALGISIINNPKPIRLEDVTEFITRLPKPTRFDDTREFIFTNKPIDLFDNPIVILRGAVPIFKSKEDLWVDLNSKPTIVDETKTPVAKGFVNFFEQNTEAWVDKIKSATKKDLSEFVSKTPKGSLKNETVTVYNNVKRIKEIIDLINVTQLKEYSWDTSFESLSISKEMSKEETEEFMERINYEISKLPDIEFIINDPEARDILCMDLTVGTIDDEFITAKAKGVDELLLPGLDYDYDSLKDVLFDYNAGKPINPVKKIDDTTFIAKLPVDHPLRTNNELGREYLEIDVELMKFILEIFYFTWQNKIFEYGIMDIRDAVNKIVRYMEIFVEYRMPWHLHKQCERIVSLIKWYAEKTIMEFSQYKIKFDYKPWKSNLHLLSIDCDHELDNLRINERFVLQNTDSKASFTMTHNVRREGFMRASIRLLGCLKIIVNGHVIQEKNKSCKLNIPLEEGENTIVFDFEGELIKIGNIEVDNCEFDDIKTKYEYVPGTANMGIDRIMQRICNYYMISEENFELYEKAIQGALSLRDLSNELVRYFDIHHLDKEKGKRITTKKGMM